MTLMNNQTVTIGGLSQNSGESGALMSGIAYLEQNPINFKKYFTNFVLKNDKHYPISGDRFPTSQHCIWALSKIIKPESYLEIGTKFGYSIAAVVLGSEKLKKVISVDIDEVQDGVRQNIDSLNRDIDLDLILSDSKEFDTEEKFDLCYVDGDHSYEMALYDMQKFWKNVKSGGIMAIDDTIRERYDGSKPNLYVYEAALEFLKTANDVQSYYLQYPSFSGFGIFVKKWC